ncbi:MAG: hypothetical protein AAF376_02350 [Pseudomonadota bacterium]
MFDKKRIAANALALIAAIGADPAIAQPIDLPIAGNSQDLVLEHQDLVIEDFSGDVRVRIDATTGSYFGNTDGERRAFHLDQPGANMFLGGSGSPQTNDDGDILLFSDTATAQEVGQASIHLDGGRGVIFLGGAGETGQMALRADDGAQRVFLDAGNAELILGNGDQGQPGPGHRGRLSLRNADGDTTAAIDGAAGRIRANQIISRANGQGGADGIDSASIFVESRNPALALLDTSGGNSSGWYVQSSSTGRLIFHPGTTAGLDGRVLVLSPDGGVCLGACN